MGFARPPWAHSHGSVDMYHLSSSPYSSPLCSFPWQAPKHPKGFTQTQWEAVNFKGLWMRSCRRPIAFTTSCLFLKHFEPKPCLCSPGRGFWGRRSRIWRKDGITMGLPIASPGATPTHGSLPDIPQAISHDRALLPAFSSFPVPC